MQRPGTGEWKRMDKKSVKFGLMSDLHLDIMHDGADRLHDFLRACDEQQVDFIINNGDFCYPKDTSKCLCSEKNLPVNLANAMKISTPVPKLELLAEFNSYHKPHYHVLGNHEMDFCSKEETIQLYGMPGAYYDFHCNGWHFLVLDSNFFKNEKGQLTDYYYGNYFDYRSEQPYLPESQLQWMKETIMSSEEPVVMFSHQPLLPVSRGLKNYDRLQEVLDEVRKEDPDKIKMCVYGHIHQDALSIDRGIIHYSINSISNHWIGPKYACRRFSEETEEKFPNLQYVFPYEKPIYGMVTLNEEGLHIEGVEGTFFKPLPAQIGFDEYEVSAGVRTRSVSWPR